MTMIYDCDLDLLVVSYRGELYIFGGFDGFHNIHFDDLYKFNPGETIHTYLPPSAGELHS